ASLSVTVGMWLERFIIVVPTLSFPRVPFPEGVYSPTWVEWGLMAGSFALFALFYLLFTKLFPIISIWEIQEGRETGLKEVEERLLTYLPDEAEANILAVSTRGR
ncbi:MAG: hypothetical protein HYU46_02815, partial [Deltaproteobacteria bacterium]|nr:hypothetical protein [Deltaproteobacteria bacterium]